MKHYRVEIKPTAEQDITRRYLQIAEDSIQNMTAWYFEMHDAICKLDAMAERCPVAPEDDDIKEGIRHLIIGNYRLLYKVDGERVDVLHVRHGSMEHNL